MASMIDQIRHDPKVEIEGKWYIAKPVVKFFSWRLRDAWGVLIGRYEAHAFESEERKRR